MPFISLGILALGHWVSGCARGVGPGSPERLNIPEVLAVPDDLDGQAALVLAVGPEGRGHREASLCVQRLSRIEPGRLPELLVHLDRASPRAFNWLRVAFEAAAERAVRDKSSLPAPELEAFVRDRTRSGPSRRLAFDWLSRVDATAPDRLVPGMIDDPATELRREAVERAIGGAAAALARDGAEAGKAAYQKAFEAARDSDQVENIASELKKLGVEPDFLRHYGFVTTWKIQGPFDNAGEAGYGAVFPPEHGGPPVQEAPGKHGTVQWIDHRTSDPKGVVDLNVLLGKEKGVLAYATATLESPSERPAQIRAGTPNALKIWLNGEKVFQRNEYHHAEDVDQHIAPVTLRKGQNVILVKVCQNEQKEEWTESWKFQLRVTDFTGGGLQ